MRSKLFVPGSRPELFDKAMVSGADAISFDLEDAVVAERKAEARKGVADFLAAATRGGPDLIVRVNPVDTPWFADDLEAVATAALAILNLPKVEDPDVVRDVARELQCIEAAKGLDRPIPILVNLETPRGVRRAAEIAAADPRVCGLQLGFGDLFEPFGISRDYLPAGDFVRMNVKLAGAEAGVPTYDSAFPAVSDMEGFRREAEASRAMGLAGKSCIHPRQIPLANEIFFPRPDDVARARAIVEAATERFGAGTGAFLLEGVMIDEPYVARARAILAIADKAPA